MQNNTVPLILPLNVSSTSFASGVADLYGLYNTSIHEKIASGNSSWEEGKIEFISYRYHFSKFADNDKIMLWKIFKETSLS